MSNGKDHDARATHSVKNAILGPSLAVKRLPHLYRQSCRLASFAACVWISTNGRSVARFTPWTALQSWRNDTFGNPEGGAGNLADDGDFDFDGLRNLIEYSIGSNATQPSGNAGPKGVVYASDGNDHLMMRVNRAQKRTDVTYAAEVSGNLSQWSTTGVTVVTDTETLFEAMDDMAITPNSRRFMRLRVTVNP